MWPYYAELGDSSGRITARLRAEHHALVLFGFHQQSKPQLMNIRGVSLGAAVRRLQASGAFSEDAVERRFTAAATTDDVDALAVLLRGLVTQLRKVDIGLDYEILFEDLVRWHYPESRERARLRWGSGYFRFEDKSSGSTRASRDRNNNSGEEK
jgi:CRISPR system Cascade subunit CasB